MDPLLKHALLFHWNASLNLKHTRIVERMFMKGYSAVKHANVPKRAKSSQARGKVNLGFIIAWKNLS